MVPAPETLPVAEMLDPVEVSVTLPVEVMFPPMLTRPDCVIVTFAPESVLDASVKRAERWVVTGRQVPGGGQVAVDCRRPGVRDRNHVRRDRPGNW